MHVRQRLWISLECIWKRLYKRGCDVWRCFPLVRKGSSPLPLPNFRIYSGHCGLEVSRSLPFENHMAGEHPQYLFVRFWQQGRSIELARGLRYALDVQVGAIATESVAKHVE